MHTKHRLRGSKKWIKERGGTRRLIKKTFSNPRIFYRIYLPIVSIHRACVESAWVVRLCRIKRIHHTSLQILARFSHDQNIQEREREREREREERVYKWWDVNCWCFIVRTDECVIDKFSNFRFWNWNFPSLSTQHNCILLPDTLLHPPPPVPLLFTPHALK